MRENRHHVSRPSLAAPPLSQTKRSYSGGKWVNTDESYELEKLNEYEYELTQSNESDLYGSYTIKIHFLYENNHWIIKNFEIK